MQVTWVYPRVLKQLRAIAPTIAVRGNVDRDTWAQSLGKAFPTNSLSSRSKGRLLVPDAT